MALSMMRPSPAHRRRSRPGSSIWHLFAALLLAAFVLALYSRLLFTNRVLATGDILLYFYPYRAYVSAVLRTGHLPFWNPYIFLGAPLLGNPQAAVLYPFHWPLIGLPVTQQIYWSAAFHSWLIGYGGYWLLRRWEYGFAAGLVTAITLAGSGFVGGLLGHINQLNAAAWLPWALLCVVAADGQRRKEGARLFLLAAGLAIAVALMLLAGHTQSVFINLAGVGVWAIGPLVVAALARSWRQLRWQPAPPFSLAWSASWPRCFVLIAGVTLGALLAAPQLLPALELSGLGLRSDGLSYGEASSFSLKPLQIGWTLLPSYGIVDLGAIFDTPGYTEYVAYVGIVALILAGLGAWKGHGAARAFGLTFMGMGLLLALGRWNPLYFVLYLVVPGFDLFRAPARWMMLYTLGVSVLAGAGFAWLLSAWPGIQNQGQRAFRRLAPALLSTVIVTVIAVELLLAALALPHSQPTAPQAVYEPRTAATHLLTDPARAAMGPAAADRFLGMSTITYDPGDMADYRGIMLGGEPSQLTPETFNDLVIGQKLQELLVPNLPLFWQIPAVDGFDGGVLPLQRYIRFAELLIPPERLVPDGRLREQIREVPSASLLGLLNAGYVVTDKVRDLWYTDVFYDRQIGATLDDNDGPLLVEVPLPFEATHLDLIGYVEGDQEALTALMGKASAVAAVTVVGPDGEDWTLPLTAGGEPGAHFADGALESAMARSSGADVAFRDVDAGRQEYRARLPLSRALAPSAIYLARVPGPIQLVVQAATLYDDRTGMFLALLPSDRGRFRLVHSGDVKIYQNLDVIPRAYLVHRTVAAPDLERALSLLQSGAVEPGRSAVVEGLAAIDTATAPGDRAEMVAYAPETVVIKTQSAAPAVLVLSDTYYPGWSATIDDEPVDIYPTNVLFRGVPVPPGEHTVIFTYQPTGWRLGLGLAALASGVLAGALLSLLWQRIRRGRAAGV